LERISLYLLEDLQMAREAEGKLKKALLRVLWPIDVVDLANIVQHIEMNGLRQHQTRLKAFMDVLLPVVGDKPEIVARVQKLLSQFHIERKPGFKDTTVISLSIGEYYGGSDSEEGEVGEGPLVQDSMIRQIDCVEKKKRKKQHQILKNRRRELEVQKERLMHSSLR
jgi:hypothetical protein